MCLDQRGFKTLIQQEAAEFLSVEQRLLNATVRTVAHSQDGVTITLTNGTTLSADYALCTFSVGVFQNDDVQFQPSLPRELLLSPSLFLLLISGTCHQHSSKKLFRGW
jgi:polyamine oxidase